MSILNHTRRLLKKVGCVINNWLIGVLKKTSFIYPCVYWLSHTSVPHNSHLQGTGCFSTSTVSPLFEDEWRLTHWPLSNVDILSQLGFELTIPGLPARIAIDLATRILIKGAMLCTISTQYCYQTYAMNKYEWCMNDVRIPDQPVHRANWSDYSLYANVSHGGLNTLMTNFMYLDQISWMWSSMSHFTIVMFGYVCLIMAHIFYVCGRPSQMSYIAFKYILTSAGSELVKIFSVLRN